jgi:hypothetical protein
MKLQPLELEYVEASGKFNRELSSREFRMKESPVVKR